MYSGSIVKKFLGWNDRVEALATHPLGMFYYNQRAVFFAASCAYMGLLFAAVYITGLLGETWDILLAFGVTWLAGVAFTLTLHRSFVDRLEDWQLDEKAGKTFPFLFIRYLFLDCTLVFVLLCLSWPLQYPAEAPALLLAANAVVYTSYIASAEKKTLVPLAAPIVVLLIVAGIAAQLQSPLTSSAANWFNQTLVSGAWAGSLLISLFSIGMISRLRTTENTLTKRQLKLIRTIQDILATSNADFNAYSEQQYRKQVQLVLRTLCNLDKPFWYRAACIWFTEAHKDRGVLYFPGPCIEFREAYSHKEGLVLSNDPLATDVALVVPSLRSYCSEANSICNFRSELVAPAAFIPLVQESKRVGTLAIYGGVDGPPVLRQDEAFLTAAGAIIANTMEQWEGRHRLVPQELMDSLLDFESLSEVFPKAVEIMQEYLNAEGCMIVYRPPGTIKMSVVASVGFGEGAIGVEYEVGRGQTGQCALAGRTIRIDDVAKHQEDFDPQLLRRLEMLHDSAVTSWMAIPIGGADENYGVVKVVNSRFRCPWFTSEDERLGEKLAIRLKILIQKFLKIEEAKASREAAETSATTARKAQSTAEKAAKDREENLMTLTHQLLGPLSGIIGYLSGLSSKLRSNTLVERVELAQAIAEDALNLCFGTTLTFAIMTGQRKAGGTEKIQIDSELRKLTKRMARANAREDLHFKFILDENFPRIVIDRELFLNVLFSLLHNAMKYSDLGSEVELVCGFEEYRPTVKVKTVGEPISESEVEIIFEKFGRGRAVKRSGRHHQGTGLGLWVARELIRSAGGDLKLVLSPVHPRLSIFVVYPPGGELSDA